MYAAAAAKSLQSCQTLCDPIDGSPPASPSLGFSRQEHWSGLPFPSPMHESESEKWKWSRSVMSDSSDPMDGLQPTRLLRPWDFLGKSTGVGCHCLLCWGVALCLVAQYRDNCCASRLWTPLRAMWISQPLPGKQQDNPILCRLSEN